MFRLWLFALAFLFHGALFAQFNLSGTAFASAANCWQLTSAINNQVGSAYGINTINLTNNFDAKYFVNLGTSDGGADGMVFLFKSAAIPAFGTGGGGIGFEGLTNCLGVEIDTYQNGNYGDPAADHLAVISQGVTNHSAGTNLAGPVSATATSSNIEDGVNHIFRVNWNATTQTLKVYFDCVLRLTYTGNIVANIFNNNPVVNFGFIGSTGGVNNVQSFCLITSNLASALAFSDTTICKGTPVSLYAGTAGPTYSWSPSTYLNSTISSSPTSTPQASTTYYLMKTQYCDTVRDTVSVNIHPQTILNLGPDTSICVGDSAILNAYSPGFATYTWNNGSTDSAIVVYTSGAQALIVTDTNGCIANDTKIINVISTPQPFLGNDTSLCAGETLQLDVSSSPGTKLWNDGSAFSTMNVDTSGTYWVQINNAGCFGSDSISIEFDPLPIFNLGNDTGYCTTETYWLHVPPGNFVQEWNTASTADSLLITTSGQYWLNITDTNQCEFRDTIFVLVDGIPATTLNADTVVCKGDTVIIGQNLPNYTYLWNTGETTPTVQAFSPNTYAVTINSTFCHSYDSIHLFSLTPPSIELGNDTTICVGESFLLNAAAPSAVYDWSTGASSPTVIANSSKPYSVTVTNVCGIVSDTIRVTTLLPPSISISDQWYVCEEDTINPYVYYKGATYLWSNGDTANTTTLSKEGSYWAMATNMCGSDSVEFNVDVKYCDCAIYIPNSFSPNGDGKNDEFGAYSECELEGFQLRIYNRWGDVVFESTSILDRWKGAAPPDFFKNEMFNYTLTYILQKEFGGETRFTRGVVYMLR